MKTVLQVEYTLSMLELREAVLMARGYAVISALGSDDVTRLALKMPQVDAVVIGHGASWDERKALISDVRLLLPGVPILALLRRDDAPYAGATFNLRADDPAGWAGTIDMLFALPT